MESISKETLDNLKTHLDMLEESYISHEAVRLVLEQALCFFMLIQHNIAALLANEEKTRDIETFHHAVRVLENDVLNVYKKHVDLYKDACKLSDIDERLGDTLFKLISGNNDGKNQ